MENNIERFLCNVANGAIMAEYEHLLPKGFAHKVILYEMARGKERGLRESKVEAHLNRLAVTMKKIQAEKYGHAELRDGVWLVSRGGWDDDWGEFPAGEDYVIQTNDGFVVDGDDDSICNFMFGD